MKRINHFSSEDFLKFILNQIDRIDEGSNNYAYTHDKVHYDPKTGRLSLEEVCLNGEGGCYGRGVYGQAYIPTEWNAFLPESLTTEPNWTLV